MKKISLILVIFIIISSLLSGCGYEYADLELRGEYSREFEGTTLTVYNWVNIFLTVLMEQLMLTKNLKNLRE